jgi:multiple sugar transport system substrate-binding protein
MPFARRALLKTGLAAAASWASTALLEWTHAWAAEQPFKPEAGAKLRFLRWSKFLDAENKATADAIAAFTRVTGVEVRVENEWQDDIQTKAAVAVNVGSGPDIAWTLNATAHLFPDKLLDVSHVADYLGRKYGGWYPIVETYGRSGGRWIGIPSILVGVLPTYRVSWVKEAGFDRFPTDSDGFLKLCQRLHKSGHPAGFAFGHSTNDGTCWCHWLLWSHGGRIVDEGSRVAINSPETLRALDYARAIYATLIPGTLSWNDASNNKAFLAGEISLTDNSSSIYGKALADKMPLAADINHAVWPIGPVGVPTELHLVFPLIVFKYTPCPNAAKALIAFLLEKEQYQTLLRSSVGYVSQSLKAYEDDPSWFSDPKITPFREVSARARSGAYAGKLGHAAAASLADFVVVDMFSEVVTGQLSPKEAVQKADKRAQRMYRL